MYNIMICEPDMLSIELFKAYIITVSKEYHIKISLVVVNNIKRAKEKMLEKSIDIIFWNFELVNRNNDFLKDREVCQYIKKTVNVFVGKENIEMREVLKYPIFTWLTQPFEMEMMYSVILRAIRQVCILKNTERQPPFYITMDNIKYRIEVDNIIYVEKEGYKSKIQLKEKVYYVYESIKSLAERLDSQFLQIHQSIIVNSNEIDSVSKNRIYLKNGIDFPIGRTYAKRVRIYMKNN